MNILANVPSKGLMAVTEFCSLCEKYKTDKCRKYRHNYSAYYDTIFSPFRNTYKNVLEIGVGFIGEPGSGIMEHLRDQGYERGASLRAWKDFFPNATIWGIDNRIEAIFQDDRIRTILCDQTDKSTLESNFQDIEFDFIIDDGSHMVNDQRTSFSILQKYLKPGGVYIIEDVNFKYWSDDDMNSFFKEVKEVYNFQSYTVFDIRTDLNFAYEDDVFFVLIK